MESIIDNLWIQELNICISWKKSNQCPESSIIPRWKLKLKKILLNSLNIYDKGIQLTAGFFAFMLNISF